jgi:pilus assembly protein CpaB
MNRRLLMIALAVMLALAGTGAVFAYIKQADTRALAGTKAADVLVVQKQIPAGTAVADLLSGGYLQSERIPASNSPTDALATVGSSMSGMVATADLQPGQIVMRQNFGALVPTTSGLAIPDGMMALSLMVATPADVAGYVQPKSEVAIFDTFKLVSKNGTAIGTSGADPNQATKLLLPRVQVLAVSAAAPKNTGTAAGSGKLIVTVALNQADAERLVHEQTLGSLYLALLSQSSKVGPAPGVDNLGTLGPVFPFTTGAKR